MAFLATTVSDNQGIYFGFAALNVVVGATDVALTLYRSTRPPRAAQASRVFLVPVGGVDARGQPFAGVGLRALSF